MTDDRQIYDELSAEFDETFRDVRGGVELTYITGEQVASRLNEVLGPFGWAFRVVEHGINDNADEAWVLGELEARYDGTTVIRQQFGSQKIKRSKATGMPLDIGFDLKGAATDAMKKCGSLIGIGLYLSHKKAPARQPNQPRPSVVGVDRPQRTLSVNLCSVCGSTDLARGGVRDGKKFCAVCFARPSTA